MTEVGDRVYIWGEHRTVKALRTRNGEREAQLIPDGRKPGARGHFTDWVTLWRIEKYGRPSGL